MVLPSSVASRGPDPAATNGKVELLRAVNPAQLVRDLHPAVNINLLAKDDAATCIWPRPIRSNQGAEGHLLHSHVRAVGDVDETAGTQLHGSAGQPGDVVHRVRVDRIMAARTVECVTLQTPLPQQSTRRRCRHNHRRILPHSDAAGIGHHRPRIELATAFRETRIEHRRADDAQAATRHRDRFIRDQTADGHRAGGRDRWRADEIGDRHVIAARRQTVEVPVAGDRPIAADRITPCDRRQQPPIFKLFEEEPSALPCCLFRTPAPGCERGFPDAGAAWVVKEVVKEVVDHGRRLFFSRKTLTFVPHPVELTV